MNKQIENTITNYKSKNINKLDIYIGNTTIKNKDVTIFNKKLDLNIFNTFLNKVIAKNYNSKKYNQRLYHYNTNYYELFSKTYLSKHNFSSYEHNSNLFVTYLESKLENYNFSCHKNYHILEQSINAFNINNEISILFINNNQIKISIILNHNIDLSIKVLNELFTITI